MADLFERVIMLKKGPIFTQVPTESLRIVAQELTEEMYFAGDRVFDINEFGEHLYIIESGRIGISLHPNPAVREFVVELGPGECFGEMNLLDNQPRSATAHVLEDTLLLSLERGKLLGLVRHHPELGFGLLRGLSLRLRAANQRLSQANKGS